MIQTEIPFLFMRGGSSRGPYLHREDLPEDRDTLADVLISMVGAGHPLNIDGIGGGAAVTTKVAMLSPSDDDWADVDYFFAQVSVEDRLVDFKPTCGNILVGVGPAALEMGLVPAAGEITEVRIRAVNTGARVAAKVRTRDGEPIYDGDAQIDGVPGTASPIDLVFYDITGSATDALFPTGNSKDVINGIEVSCVDVAMPIVFAKAESFGITGTETAAELDENKDFFAAMEAIRLKAGALMGMGDVTQSVTPKFGLIAPPRNGGTATIRYFMPWKTHPSLAVTGSQCIGACLLCPGTVGEGIGQGLTATPAHLRLEHPMGHTDVTIDYKNGNSGFEVISANLTRTARKLASGKVFIPSSVWGKT